ncbi:chemotaxis protein CheB [Aquirhabdus sp.]|uniref:chemotaxis protein CheB n=1 Tax=Aquirhabdus sp. TaxID=2824160 RepID=UPI00396CE1DC
MHADSPQLFIVADNPLQRIALADAMMQCGFDVLHNIHSNRLKPEHCHLLPSLWLLDVEHDDYVLDMIGDDAPLMIGITRAPSPVHQKAYAHWVKTLSEKVIKFLGDAPPLLTEIIELEPEAEIVQQRIVELSREVEPQLVIMEGAEDRPSRHMNSHGQVHVPSHSKNQGHAHASDSTGELNHTGSTDWQYVCILAASMGGPEAVKRFLDRVPVSVPVTFILVQHIDPNMQSVLPRVLSRHNAWQFDTEQSFTEQSGSLQPSLFLKAGHVLLVPAARQIDFGANGEVFAFEQIESDPVKYEPWPGHYQPSINEVMRRAAEAFGSRLMTIVFSGMGDDGSDAVDDVQSVHGVIWAQTASSCVCASQPDHVRASGKVSFNGTPEILAEHLQQFISEQSISID